MGSWDDGSLDGGRRGPGNRSLTRRREDDLVRERLLLKYSQQGASNEKRAAALRCRSLVFPPQRLLRLLNAQG